MQGRQRERDSLVVGRVVGDVVDAFVRKVRLRVTYTSTASGSGSGSGRDVANGYDFKPSAVAQQPTVEVVATPTTDPTSLFTLVMVDPDAPSPSNPTLREYLHWLVTDIPALTGATNGHEVVSYESPRPSLGIHRFVFVVFQQQQQQQQQGCQTIYAPGWRQNFCIRDFAELYNLGSPVAAVYFNCQRESGSGGRRTMQW